MSFAGRLATTGLPPPMLERTAGQRGAVGAGGCTPARRWSRIAVEASRHDASRTAADARSYREKIPTPVAAGRIG